MSDQHEPTIFGGRSVLSFREDHDRRAFLRNALLVGVGATYVASSFASRDAVAVGQAAEVRQASAAQSDLDILNYALTLEYLEFAFYDRGVNTQGLLDSTDLALITPIRDHEKAHVLAVRSTIKGLGGKPVAKPKVQFPKGTFTSKKTFLATASTFEELGVKAYHGQVPLVKSKDILAAAASIAGVESRHAAILADLTGGDPFPRPIEAHLPMSAVLKAASPFIR